MLRGDLSILVMWEFIPFCTPPPQPPPPLPTPPQTSRLVLFWDSQHTYCGHICVTPAAVWSLTSIGWMWETQHQSQHTQNYTNPVWLQHVSVCYLFVCSHGLLCKIKSKDCKGFKTKVKELSLTIQFLFLRWGNIVWPPYRNVILYSAMICRSYFPRCGISFS